MTALSIKNITKTYPGLDLFRDFSLDVAENRITCILGPSGCGKTTLLNIIAGNTSYEKGELLGFDGLRSYIFQEPRLLPWKTVLGNVVFPLKDRMPQTRYLDIARHNLELVGLDRHTGLYPYQLSGGMKQRVSIARAFSFPSVIILMDEAFKALDIKLKNNLMDTFIRLWNENRRTVIAVTHEVDEALHLGHEIVVISGTPVKVTGRYTPEGEPGDTDRVRVKNPELKQEIIMILTA